MLLLPTTALNSSTGTAMKILRQGTAIVGAAKTVTVKTKKRARGSAFEFDEVDVRKGRVQRQRVVEKPSAGSQVKASGRRYVCASRPRALWRFQHAVVTCATPHSQLRGCHSHQRPVCRPVVQVRGAHGNPEAAQGRATCSQRVQVQATVRRAERRGAAGVGSATYTCVTGTTSVASARGWQALCGMITKKTIVCYTYMDSCDVACCCFNHPCGC